MINIQTGESTFLSSRCWQQKLSIICPKTKCIENKCLDTIYIDV